MQKALERSNVKDNDEEARPGKSARGQHPSWACWTSELGLSAPIQGSSMAESKEYGKKRL